MMNGMGDGKVVSHRVGGQVRMQRRKKARLFSVIFVITSLRPL